MTKRGWAIPNTTGYVLTGIAATYYDPGNSLFGVPLITRKHVGLIRLCPGDRLLDVGCGTGETISLLCRKYGDTVRFHGIDPSLDILGVARRKLKKRANACVEWAVGENLPFVDGAFNWVVSSLTMHHMPTALKKAVAIECLRVLRPQGRLLISDFGSPTNRLGAFLAAVWKDHAFTDGNLQGVIPEIIAEVGFQVETIEVQAGIIQYVLATRPSTD